VKKSLWVLSGVGLAVLVACGGGGGGDLTISGTAATGAAINGGTVEFVCASGTKTGTTAADGSYKVTVSAGVLPCLGQVTDTDTAKSVYHTLVADSGSAANTNITPMTELVVASAAGTDTSAYYSSFKSLSASDKTAAITADKVAAAKTAVKTTLVDVGVTTLGDIDLLTGTLKPGSSSDAYDKALETLKTNLAVGGSDVKTLSNTVAAASASGSGSGTGTGTGTATDTPTLPADLLIKPPVATCTALRSTTYRYVSHYGTELLILDAAKLTGTDKDGKTSYLKAVDNDSCHFQVFTNQNFSDTSPRDLMVSSSGFGVIRSIDGPNTGHPSLAVFFPEQTGLNTLANAAGKWNALSLEATSTSGTYAGHLIQSELGSTGISSSLTYCGKNNDWDISKCLSLIGTEAANATGTLSVNTDDNGYYITDQGKTTPGGKRFVYKTGSGDVVAVTTWNDGSFDIATKQRTLSAPVVSTTGTNSWTLAEDSALLAKPVTAGTTTIVSVADATLATTSFVRTNVTTGLTPTDLHSETLTNNTPYNGFRLRAAGTDTSVTPNQSYSRLNQLPLKGMGVTVSVNETNKRFQLSVNKPN